VCEVVDVLLYSPDARPEVRADEQRTKRVHQRAVTRA
jgi:hypothetical protein